MPSRFRAALAIALFVLIPLSIASAFTVSVPAELNAIVPSVAATTSTATSTASIASLQTLIAQLESELSALVASHQPSVVSTNATTTSPVTFARVLSLGSTGADVSALQQILKSLGLYDFPTITGYFGALTERAIAAFQTVHGLEPVGYTGPKTRALLNGVYGAAGGAPTTAVPSSGVSSPIGAQATSSSTSLAIPSLFPVSAGYGGGGGSSSPTPTPSLTPDTTPPTVSLTVPTASSTVSGTSVTLTATASDNVAIANVQFKVDGTNIGSAFTSSPYTTTWNSKNVADGTRTLYAVAEDTSGNYATSSISVTVDNTPPVISAISSGTPSTASATITWTTDGPATSVINYGTTSGYGTASSSAALATSHSITLTGLTYSTTYHFQVQSADSQGNTATSSDQTFITAAPSLPSGALGIWYIDQYTSSPRPMIANAASATSTSANLFSAPRNLFANAGWWVAGSATVTDFAATAPDGTNDASTVNGTGNWIIHPTLADNLPAGTYTMAINAKTNTGSSQQFSFYKDNTATRSTPQTATSAWQRFTYTFTMASPQALNRFGLGSIDGSTAGNIQIADFELYSGSSDLGPENYGGHLYLGSSAYDTRPVYASGALDLSANGYGLIQFPFNQNFTNITVQALVSKVAAGSAYQSILSDAESYTTLSAMTEESTAPFSYFGGAGNAVGPSQYPGLWIAQGQGYHVITLRYDGTNFSYWIDDVKILSAPMTLSPVAAADFFVNITSATNLYGGNKFAGAIAVWNRALSDSEIRNAVTFQQARAALSSITATSVSRVLVAEGDSITGAFSYSYPYLFGSSASPALYGVDFAISGSTIATLNSRAATVDGIIPPNTQGREFILSVLIGANDLSSSYSGPGGTGVSGWLADLASYLDARRAAGWKVVLCTVLPRTAAGFNAARDAANTTLRTWVGVHADALCDFAADPTMGPDAAASNTTYYADGTHPTAAGQAILEPIYQAAINSI